MAGEDLNVDPSPSKSDEVGADIVDTSYAEGFSGVMATIASVEGENITAHLLGLNVKVSVGHA